MALKIIVSANTSWYLWNFRCALIDELISRGHEVVLIAPRDRYTQRLQERHGCQVMCLPMKGQRQNLARELHALWVYCCRFYSIHPDLYLAFTVKPILYGGLAAKLLGAVTIPTITGLGTAFIRESTTTRLIEFMYRKVLPGASTIFFQNHTDKELFITRKLANKNQSRVCPGSGVDLHRFSYTRPQLRDSEDGVKFLMVARLLRDKGVTELVQAAEQVRRRFPATQFLLAGKAGADNSTAIDSRVIAKWCERGVITHLGESDDIVPVIADVDCVVLPSYREGLSRSLLEAAAVGRPIVTTNVPGCADVVDNEITGFLCESHNAVSLERQLLRFISLSPEKREAMGKAARKKIEAQFSEVRVIREYIRAISDAADSDCKFAMKLRSD